MNKALKKFLPHLYVLLGFLVISIAYNYPMLEGKRLYQNDIIQAEGGAKELKDYHEKTGELGMWTNSMFGGMPAFMVYIDYPLSLGTQLGRLFNRLVPKPANYIFLYMLGFYVMMMMLGYPLGTAVLASIAFAFASYNIINIEAGHVSKVLALAFAPPFIGAVIMTYRGNYLLGASLAGIFAALELYANHVQITYYMILVLVFYVIYKLIVVFTRDQNRKESLKRFGLATASLLVAGALAVGTHASRLITTYEYSQQTIRGKSELTNTEIPNDGDGLDKEYAFRWSYGIWESFSLLIPNYVGGGSGSGAVLDDGSDTYKFIRNNINPQFRPDDLAGLPFYWGNQPGTAGPAYAGAIICFLVVFALFASPNPIKWWLLVASVFLLVIAWGKNFAAFNYLLFDTLPLFNKFRAVTMALSALQLFLVWLAALGLRELFREKPDKARAVWALKYSAGIVGGFALLIAIIGPGLQDFRPDNITQASNNGDVIVINSDEIYQQQQLSQLPENISNGLMRAIRDDRASMQRTDAFRSFIFIALAAVLIWFYLKGQIPPLYTIIGLTALVLIDLWMVDRRYLNADNFVKRSAYEDLFEPSPADRQIQQDPDPHFRVWNQSRGFTDDALTSYHHSSIAGYHGAKLRRYQELIEAHLSKNNLGVFSMLNTKYVMRPDENGQLQVLPNPGAMGAAWFVQHYDLVENADEELAALTNLNPSDTAFIDKRFAEQLKGLDIQPSPQDTIYLTSYAPDKMEYKAKTRNNRLALFSDIYYVDPGKAEWKFYIDGKEVPHLRANYVLRGLVIPAGNHEIRGEFVAPSYQRGQVITGISSLLLLLALGFAIFVAYRRSKTDSEEEIEDNAT